MRLSALEGETEEPWVELSAGTLVLREYVEPGVNGLRWLNLTGLKSGLAAGATVGLAGHGVAVAAGPATLRIFANRLNLQGRVLILATHPDDAEIAAFGLYAGSKATIVTLTCGNAGDANYKAQFPDPAEQYRFKGYLRAVDSVTAPWQGGIPPERCFNLGYFDARLKDMHATPGEVVPELYGPNRDISVYRRANIGRLLDNGPRTNTWNHLVEDLARIFKKVKPQVIVLPHPFLDDHLDHVFTTVAAAQALAKWKRPVTFLVYTNHADKNLYPYGPAGTPAPLPHWAGRELAVEGFYAHPVSPDMQRRQLFAMETMHDLRLSPAEQAACLPPGIQPDRDDYPRVPAVDYFRRGPRPEELFFVFGRDGLQALVRTYLAEAPAAPPPARSRVNKSRIFRNFLAALHSVSRTILSTRFCKAHPGNGCDFYFSLSYVIPSHEPPINSPVAGRAAGLVLRLPAPTAHRKRAAGLPGHDPRRLRGRRPRRPGLDSLPAQLRRGLLGFRQRLFADPADPARPPGRVQRAAAAGARRVRE